jgi:LuxR family transcriptional regulator, maltose regulon positive regulatory protein
VGQLRGNPQLAKTTRPRVAAVFARERLFHQLEANRSAACTWIAGPPGAGKTALLASFVYERSPVCVWHQIDADDADPTAFFSYLTRGAQAALGSGVAKALPPCTPDAAFSLASFARQFFRELFALAPGLMLVQDDYHEAPPNCPLHEILRVAIEQVPPGAHIAVLSRTHAPPPLARAQASGAVRVLGWEQLKLTAEEVAGIARVHGVTLDPGAAAMWLDRCGAWPAGLRLLLRGEGSSAPRLAADAPPHLLFDYLGEEVFRKFPKALQSQMFALAVPSRIPADLAGELAGTEAAEAELKSLAEQSLFTTVSEDAPRTYRFHPLFRGFLLDRAEIELGPAALLELRRHAACVMQRRGLTAEAAQVLVEAQSWGDLASLAIREAPRLMGQGRHATLSQWLRRVPRVMIEQDAWLLYWLGASQVLHDPAAARASLERAFELFVERGDSAGLLLAWSGVVDCIFHEYTDANQFGAWIDRLDAWLASGTGFPSPDVEARVTFSMFVALSFHRPQHPEFAKWRSRLQEFASGAGDPMFRLMARQHLLTNQIWSGDLRGATAELKQLKRELAQRPLTPLIELIGHLLDSTLSLYSGDSAACFEAIQRGLTTSQASGIHIWDKILLGQGAALALGHGELERGMAFAQRRAVIARRGDAEEQSLYHAIEAWTCWLRGDRANALIHVEHSVSFSNKMGLPHFNAIGLLAVAIVSFECGAQESALLQVRDARALGVATRNPMIRWMADLLEAYIRLRRGEDAESLIESAMALGGEQGYRHFFFWPPHAVARVCLEALTRGIHADVAIELIDKAQLPAPVEAMDAERWPWPLKIFTLGRFTILVRGATLSFEGKVQHGPLNLLKALIALGGRDVAEHRLIDALWPDAAGDAGEQSLATTLSRLRKLIGVHAIKRQDGRLSLEPALCWVDCWALERALGSQSTGAAPEALGERIRALYRGHFLQGDDAAPWALHLRERLRVAVVARLDQFAQSALNQGDVTSALRLFELGLKVDDLVEDFYAGLIRCHGLSGQASQAVMTYHRCQRVLCTRLGVMPSDRTTRTYLAAIDGLTAGPESKPSP